MTSDELAAYLEPAPGSSLEELGAVTDESLPGYQPVEPPQGITENDLLHAFVPGYSGETVSDEPATPQVPASQGAPSTSSRGYSVSVSEKGYSPEKHKQIQKSGSRLDRRVAAKEAAIESEYDPHLQALDQSEINQAEAIRQEVAAEQAIVEQRGVTAGWEQTENQRLADREAEINAQSQARVTQARANFEASLADFKASGVNPNQLFQSMGKGEQFGMMAAIFVHDFLGAKGIKTSALDTWNKAIERNIDAQIQGIKNKGEVTQGFKTLWDMQRAESASDAEARSRMIVFAKEAQKNEIRAHMAQFETGLTAAKGMAALAAADKETVKAKFEVFKHMQQAESQMVSQEYQRHAQEVNASLQARQIKLQEQAAEQARLKAQAETQDKLRQGLLPDLDTGQMTRRLRDDLTPEERRDTRNLAEATLSLKKNSEEFIKLLGEAEAKGHKNKNWWEVGRFVGTNQAKIEALHSRIMADKLRIDSGLAVTDPEYIRQLKELPLNKTGTVADIKALANGYVHRAMEKYNGKLQFVSEDVKPGDPGYGTRWGSNYSGALSSQEHKAGWDAGGQDPSLPTDKALQGLSRQDAFKPAAASTVDAAIEAGIPVKSDLAAYAKSTGDKSFYNKKGDIVPPAYAVHLSDLKNEAKGGDTVAKEKLKDIADGYLPDGTDPNSPEGQKVRKVATYYYAQMAGVVPVTLDYERNTTNPVRNGAQAQHSGVTGDYEPTRPREKTIPDAE